MVTKRHNHSAHTYVRTAAALAKEVKNRLDCLVLLHNRIQNEQKYICLYTIVNVQEHGIVTLI